MPHNNSSSQQRPPPSVFPENRHPRPTASNGSQRAAVSLRRTRDTTARRHQSGQLPVPRPVAGSLGVRRPGDGGHSHTPPRGTDRGRGRAPRCRDACHPPPSRVEESVRRLGSARFGSSHRNRVTGLRETKAPASRPECLCGSYRTGIDELAAVTPLHKNGMHIEERNKTPDGSIGRFHNL